MIYRVNAGPVAPIDSWIRDPAVGGGRIIGEVCHFVDLLSFLAGAAPVRVQAVGSESSPGSAGPDAQLSATLTFGDGSIATIAYSGDGDPAFPKERLEVLGQGRVAVLDDFRTLEMSVGGRKRSLRAERGPGQGPPAGSRGVRGRPSPREPNRRSRLSEVRSCATSRATFAIEDAIRSGEASAVRSARPCAGVGAEPANGADRTTHPLPCWGRRGGIP